VERAADAPAPAEEVAADPPQDLEAPAGEVERAAETTADGKGASEGEQTEEAAPVDPVERAVQAGAEALQRAAEAIDIVHRATDGEARAVIVLEGAELRRSLSLVSRLGYVLSELTYVIFDADFEKEIEGDESTVPAQLREGLRTLATAYKAMSAEEVDELLAGLKVDAAVARGVYDLTLAGDILERSPGDEISAETAGQLQTLFDGFVARGWAPMLPEVPHDELQRQVDSLTVARDTLLRSHDEMTAKVSDLADQVKRFSETVTPAKTGGSLARAVEKTEDAPGSEAGAPTTLSADDLQRGLAAMPKDERDMLLTRMALANPLPVIR